MFDLRSFIKRGFLQAVGGLADYRIVLNAAGWMDRGVLTTDDLAEIQAAIDAQYAAPSDDNASDENGVTSDGDDSASDENGGPSDGEGAVP